MPQDTLLTSPVTAARAASEPLVGAPPRLLSITTAVPPIVLRQADVMATATRLFEARASEVERLLPAFVNAGISTRHSCMPLEWYEQPHGWAERNRLYIDHALTLLERAARDALAHAGLSAADIDAIVTVSTTGIATPSLDAQLMERIPFRADVTRLPVFGLGCAGGVLGLARAASLARTMPGSRVLFLVVELCALTFRKGDLSKSNIIAAALFGDGAAAAVLGTDADAAALSAPTPAIAATGEHTWPNSLDVMGWHVEDDGLGVLFSRDIPSLVRTRFRPALDRFLAAHDLTLADFDSFACHPGGTKVVAALEDAISLPTGSLDVARDVLAAYGNMSAATVLFVLERIFGAGLPPRHILMSALGPGFTAAFLTLDRRRA